MLATKNARRFRKDPNIRPRLGLFRHGAVILTFPPDASNILVNDVRTALLYTDAMKQTSCVFTLLFSFWCGKELKMELTRGRIGSATG